MKMFNFDERLYTLDVGGVPWEEIPRIIDPNDEDVEAGNVVCYYPTKNQLIQLALILWQVATRDRNSISTRGGTKFENAEKLCTMTRNIFKSLLLPYVDGDQDKARDLCIGILRENKTALDKYIKGWAIVKKPNSVWVDKDTNGIFICENEGRILVGLNPTNYIFVYGQEK